LTRNRGCTVDECNGDITPTDRNLLKYNHPHRGPHPRVVTQLPLGELWRDDGFSSTMRRKSLTLDDVREFLSSGTAQFVVADV